MPLLQGGKGGGGETNVDLFRDTYKSTVVPAHCTASQLRGIFEDSCRGGVNLEDASKDWLDAIRLHSDLTRKVIAEINKCGRSFDNVRLYLFVRVYFLQQEKTDEHLAHLRGRHQGFKVQQLQEGPVDKGYSISSAVVHNLLQDPDYPPPLHRQRVIAHQRPLTRSWKPIFLGKSSPRPYPPVVSVASRDTSGRVATASSPTCDRPQGPKNGALKEDPPAKAVAALGTHRFSVGNSFHT